VLSLDPFDRVSSKRHKAPALARGKAFPDLPSPLPPKNALFDLLPLSFLLLVATSYVPSSSTRPFGTPLRPLNWQVWVIPPCLWTDYPQGEAIYCIQISSPEKSVLSTLQIITLNSLAMFPLFFPHGVRLRPFFPFEGVVRLPFFRLLSFFQTRCGRFPRFFPTLRPDRRSLAFLFFQSILFGRVFKEALP